METDVDVPHLVDVTPLLSRKIRDLVEALPTEVTELTESELIKLRTPSDTDRLLRANFWMVVDDCKKRGVTKPAAARFYDGVCNAATFYAVIKNPLRLKHMLLPPANYEVRMKSLMDMGLAKLSEILTMPLTSQDGTPNVPLMNAVIRAATAIREAQMGAAVQRTIAVSASVSPEKIPANNDELDKRILEMKESLQVVDANSVDVTSEDINE